MDGMSSTMADMASPTSMSGMDMSGMDMSGMGGHSSSDSSSMSMMAMTFFTSTNTPLWSTSWTPATTGQYAGTCIFLIFLAVILHALLALKGIMEMHVWRPTMGHMHGHAQHGAPQENRSSEDDKTPMVQDGLLATVQAHARPWRLNADGTRAILDLLIAGIGYLLMLAVMTFNVGYFLSVLAGIFLGSLVLGRFTSLGRGIC